MVYLKITKRKGFRYASIVQGYKENGQVKHKQIKNIGRYDQLIEKLARSEPIITLSDISLEASRDYGAVMAMSKIAEMLNLKDVINKYAKKRNGIDTGTLIEILTINRAVEPKSKLQISRWYEGTVLPFVYGLPSHKLNPQVLCEVLDKPSTKAIFMIHKELNEIMKEKFNLDASSVIYDITSTYFEGEKCILAKFGYSRDHLGNKKQIIIGIVVSLDKGLPVYHFVKEGNTADVSTQIETNSKLVELGIKNAYVVHDRGMVSTENFRLSDKLNYSYITALESETKQSNYMINKLKNQDFFVVEENIRKIKQDDGIIKEVKYTARITERIVREHKRSKKYVLVYSEDLAYRKNKSRNDRIQRAKIELDLISDKVSRGTLRKKITVYGQIKKSIKGLTKYFEVKPTERDNKIVKFEWRFKDELEEKAKQNDGYYILICSDSNKSKLEIYSAFKYKCEIEAIIRDIKQEIDLHPLRHWKCMRPEAQVFVCILGYLLKKVLKVIMNDNQIYDSVSYVMDYLEDIKTIDIKIDNKVVRKNTKSPDEVKDLLRILEVNPEI